MNIPRKRIVEEARKYLGTPFHHQARLRGIGVDCIGLLVGVAKAAGLYTYDCTDYSRYPSGKKLIKELHKVMELIEIADAKPGDLLVFWISRMTKEPQHVAFKTDKGMLHTYATVGKVVEHTICAKWKRRLCGAFRFKEPE